MKREGILLFNGYHEVRMQLCTAGPQRYRPSDPEVRVHLVRAGDPDAKTLCGMTPYERHDLHETDTTSMVTCARCRMSMIT